MWVNLANPVEIWQMYEKHKSSWNVAGVNFKNIFLINFIMLQIATRNGWISNPTACHFLLVLLKHIWLGIEYKNPEFQNAVWMYCCSLEVQFCCRLGRCCFWFQRKAVWMFCFYWFKGNVRKLMFLNFNTRLNV